MPTEIPTPRELAAVRDAREKRQDFPRADDATVDAMVSFLIAQLEDGNATATGHTDAPPDTVDRVRARLHRRGWWVSLATVYPAGQRKPTTTITVSYPAGV